MKTIKFQYKVDNIMIERWKYEYLGFLLFINTNI